MRKQYECSINIKLKLSILALILTNIALISGKTFKEYLEENKSVLKSNRGIINLVNKELDDIIDIESALVKIDGKIQPITQIEGLCLFLGNNNLISLPESFGQLNNLRQLNLDDNRLTTLPESFGQLNNLSALSLNNNKLTALPESFVQINTLETLFLNNNRLATLPESFSQLSKLDKLNLNNNNLTILPESFGLLSNLRQLNLDNNK